MSTALSQADHVLLHHVSWQQFEKLLLELGESRAARLAYDNGTLEIMIPLPEHEIYKEAISDIIKEIADTFDLDYESLGSTTWKRERRLAGVEPDNCFYFQNEAAIRGKLEFDLEQDPPPDLALEIDITNKSLARLSIYARLGIPEIWCYQSGDLKIYQLQGQTYLEVETSAIFPSLPMRQLPALVERYRGKGRRALRRAARKWAEDIMNELE